MSERIVWLDDQRAADAAVAGTKAATMAGLASAGHRVPPGFIVPADVRAADIREELSNGLGKLSGPVAVRSSSASEDLGGESYAGQYETVLEVTTTDELVAAIGTVRDSATSERAMAYGGAEPAPMSVLVQRQVDPEAAGVAFSANPVTGDRTEAVVSAVRGLGERLVSGEASPDEWVVRDGQAENRASPEESITAAQAMEVANLARRLEAERGTPQDIEWAIADGELYLLQSRPITALPVPPENLVPGEGTWSKDPSHYPEPMTPLGASTFLPMLDAALAASAAEFGLLLEGMHNVSIGGEVYMQTVPVGGKSGPPPPAFVIGMLARLIPPLRKRMRAAADAVASGLLESVPRQWDEQWREEYRAETSRMRDMELAKLDDQGLDKHLGELLDLSDRGQKLHFRLFIPHVVAVHELVSAGEELLGWSTVEVLDLVAGLSDASSEPARALNDLAAKVRAAVGATGDLIGELRDKAPELATEVDAYVDSYGHRTPNYDPGAPTLAEQPSQVAALLRAAVSAQERDVDGDLAALRKQARQRANTALAAAKPEDRPRFEQILARAESVYGLREDNVFWTDNVPSGLIRRAAVEAGERLAARKQLRRAADVAFLEIGELRDALAAPGRDVSATATRRRAEQAWVAAHPGPAFHGDEPAPPPDPRFLPEAGRRLNSALLWMMDQEFAPTAVASDDGMPGTPGSPGRYTGPVRVIRRQADFHRLQPGEVLVAPITTPPWSVLFGIVGAVVTDGGGTLSHAAIVAREHGIPAVLNTGDATSQLADGQIVTVDGAAGVVRPG